MRWRLCDVMRWRSPHTIWRVFRSHSRSSFDRFREWRKFKPQLFKQTPKWIRHANNRPISCVCSFAPNTAFGEWQNRVSTWKKSIRIIARPSKVLIQLPKRTYIAISKYILCLVRVCERATHYSTHKNVTMRWLWCCCCCCWAWNPIKNSILRLFLYIRSLRYLCTQVFFLCLVIFCGEFRALTVSNVRTVMRAPHIIS